MPAPRVLVVVDEPKVAAALAEGLRREGYEVTPCATAEEALERASCESFEVVVLDRTLRDRDGLEILLALRRRGVLIPALVLTTLDATLDRVAGLGHCDDCLTKPFAFPELLARVRALLQGGPPGTGISLAVADLMLDVGARKAVRGGRELDLTPREFELLEYLVRHRGGIVSREMLARDLWKETARGAALDDIIDAQVAHLRKKVDEGFSPRLLHTVRGLGIVLSERAPA